ncbi:hypothetical protein BD289DRAFT_450864 [Coniella lustricola]|uniref:Uncharacterized protein n=1 Tax=Coniella lustricola TaxID=2025994 RepID=A0A2T3AH25_9PEZI|nr:hypothetical protein BD289DRAFT_450864 [Coniella lustricola]
MPKLTLALNDKNSLPAKVAGESSQRGVGEARRDHRNEVRAGKPKTCLRVRLSQPSITVRKVFEPKFQHSGWETFGLTLEKYPRLILDQPPVMIKVEDNEPRPLTPEDDITKTLFLHNEAPKIKWVGKHTNAILNRHIEKYDRLKTFWLFEDIFGTPSLRTGLRHDKRLLVAHKFREEMQSPWVQAWLEDLIGAKDVEEIMDYMTLLSRFGFQD